MTRSETIAALAEALAQAQGLFLTIPKGSRNPHLGYRYADLADVIDAVRPALAEHGLSIVQTIESIEQDHLGLCTLLTHASGQWIQAETTFPITAQKGLTQAQAIGVAATYARRYAVMAMLNVAAGEDTDARGEPTGGSAKPEKTEKPEKPESEPAQPLQAERAVVNEHIQAFKRTIKAAEAAQDVEDALQDLLDALPDFDQSRFWPRILQLADERKMQLLQPTDDTPDEADSEAVNGPDPEEVPHDPETGEILEPGATP